MLIYIYNPRDNMVLYKLGSILNRVVSLHTLLCSYIIVYIELVYNFFSFSSFLVSNRVTRVEPKTYLANERTFINWLSMAVQIGSIASALAGPTACQQLVKQQPVKYVSS